jgi:hypothetical protein
MSTLKEKLENNILWVVIVFSIGGFLAGLTAYKYGLDMYKHEVISSAELTRLKEERNELKNEIQKLKEVSSKGKVEEPPKPTPTQIAPENSPISNKISPETNLDINGSFLRDKIAVGTVRKFTFSGNSNEPVKIIIQSKDASFTLAILSPSEQTVFENSLGYNSWNQGFTPKENGTFTIVVTGNDGDGEFSIGLKSL